MTTPVGLKLPVGLPFGRWKRAGTQIARIANTSAWCLGDWLVYGQERYADRYQQAVSAAQLDYQTLRNYAWVARRFPLQRRREALSFQHHAEVASLPATDQDEWLDRAQASEWSRNQLRLAIREARRTGENSPSTEAAPAVLPRISVSDAHIARWRRASERTHDDFARWIVDALDFVAAASGTTGPAAEITP